MYLNLGANERVIFSGHPSWRAIIGFYIKGALLIAAVVALGRWIGDWGAAQSTLWAAIGIAVIVLIGFIRRVTVNYVITNRRLNIKHGIISRNVQEARIERVQDVSYNQSVYQRLVRIGDVIFDTASNDPSSGFVFAGVADPAGVVDQVHHASESFSDGSSGLGDLLRSDPSGDAKSQAGEASGTGDQATQ